MEKILFCAGAPQPFLEIIEQFNPTVIVGIDGGVKQLQKVGVDSHIAIGDFDSIDVPNIKNLIQLPCEKDDTDLQFAFKYVLSQYDDNDIEAIVVLGALNGGRLDHTICNIWLGYTSYLMPYFNKLIFIERQNTLKFFTAGEYTLIKEADKNYLSFILMTSISELTLEKVKYPVTKKKYHQPVSLISNEFLYDEMHFSFNEGIIAVIQSKD